MRYTEDLVRTSTWKSYATKRKARMTCEPIGAFNENRCQILLRAVVDSDEPQASARRGCLRLKNALDCIADLEMTHNFVRGRAPLYYDSLADIMCVANCPLMSLGAESAISINRSKFIKSPLRSPRLELVLCKAPSPNVFSS